jgi:glycine/D-amino acid oxidase-like deaminating enzyme
MRIAILGAGGVGVCAALELAKRGYQVDLYDENPQVLTRASYNNEGKIHLGLVYAKDPSLKTAQTMIRGAVHFTSTLARWIDIDSDRLTVSTPYYYAVHKETMTSVEELEQHYGRCKALFDDACSAAGRSYLNGERTLVAEKLSRVEMENVIEADFFLAVFRTSERAVDPRGIALLLREAVDANPRIRVVANAHVTNAAWADSGQLVCSFRLEDEEYSEAYDQVASTLWHGRLAIDACLGLAPKSGWIYRYKLGGRINTSIRLETIPSLTIVLGPFGDIVNLGACGVYFSWYPIGMIGTSRDLKPPDWDHLVPLADRQKVLRQSFEELGRLCPPLRSVHDAESADPCGGVIFAWGDTDIDHADSGLHARHEIGIHSVRNYHSVNTGKYTMVPYLAFKTAERILSLS